MEGPNEYYRNERLTFTQDRLLDSKGNAIMMDWEEPIMKAQAATVCQNGGDILNVGFGMGYIDSYIQEHNPSRHYIIEYHPDVQQKMINDGWLEKPNVVCIFSPWQICLDELPKFDGIYFDTWHEDWNAFHIKVKDLLKPGGIYSFFNNPRSDLKMLPKVYSILSESFDITFESMEINRIADKEEQRTDGKVYWQSWQNTYWNPTCKLKQK